MSSSKLIVIIGATGNQGGSVANVFLKEQDGNTKAQALAACGAEIFQADTNTPATLSTAFEGANAIFAVSDYWGLFGDPANKYKAQPGQPLNVWVAEHETQQLKNIIDAAAQVPTLERFILSSLSNATEWSKGVYTHVYHFDLKAKTAEYGSETYPDLWAKTSIYQAGLFLIQLIGHLEQDVKIPFIAAEEDSGHLVKALILQEPAGKNLIGYRGWLTPRELASAFTRATGLDAEVVTLSKGHFPPSISGDFKAQLQDNMGYWNEFGYEGRDDPTVVHPRDLKSPPSLDTVEDYLKKQGWTKVFGS
ncbi:hypothetical protein BJX62DRAFT_229207 [Aspergillus germanicus]